MQKSIIALYIEIALRSAFGGVVLRPSHDATLTMGFNHWALREQGVVFFLQTRDSGYFQRQPYIHPQDISPAAFHQNNRPINQPHCARTANAFEREKAAARTQNIGLTPP